jgi:hypothetical protein
MLFAVLAIQPFLWDGPLGPNHHEDPDGLLYAILDNAVEYGGGLLILMSLALLLGTGIGNRWFTAGRGIARFTSIVTLAAAVYIKLGALGMVLVSSGGDEAMLWVLLAMFIFVPMSVTAASARRTLALC